MRHEAEQPCDRGHSLADKLSRLDAIKDDNAGSPGDVLASYKYNGTRRMVVEDFEQPGVRLDHWGQAADTYAGFDRFGADHPAALAGLRRLGRPG